MLRQRLRVWPRRRRPRLKRHGRTWRIRLAVPVVGFRTVVTSFSCRAAPCANWQIGDEPGRFVGPTAQVCGRFGSVGGRSGAAVLNAAPEERDQDKGPLLDP